MDFWGYPSDLCLFADNLQNPVTDDEEQESTKNKTLNILYSCFLFYLISTSVTCYKYRNKIQESNNKNLFFNVTVQISGQTLNLLS
jgi:hypothetical protein